MLDSAVRQIVKATAPVLETHGVALTRHFYARMFDHNPELREIFNQGHQRNGSQQHALAMAVAAYARHIDDPSVLAPVLERITHKHVSLGIRAEHYGVVGRHLLASIVEVLGEAATPDVVDAWAQAYGQLADLLIAQEKVLYQSATEQQGGWTGWRTFRVAAKRAESEEITSFELQPADGGVVPSFRPGQYISLRVLVPELGHRQARQYSLSDAPGKSCLRISVKREDGVELSPPGMVSNYLHQQIQEGDFVELAAPNGDFYLHEDRNTPVVLISAGVGITPMMSMLEHLNATGTRRTVRFYHAARHGQAQAFATRVRNVVQALPQASAWFVHEAGQDGDEQGRLDLSRHVLPAEADHYVCGPQGFMTAQIAALRAQGVPAERIHAEAFGTGGVAG